MKILELNLIRHGKTAGNLEGRYIGRTDEALCARGIAELEARRYPQADVWFLSPMRRCVQTAYVMQRRLAGVQEPSLEAADVCGAGNTQDTQRFRPGEAAVRVTGNTQDTQRFQTGETTMCTTGNRDTQGLQPEAPDGRGAWNPGLVAVENVIMVPDFRECDFGLFENKNYKELSDCPQYQQWIDSNGTLPFPGGETVDAFKERCCRAFEATVEQMFAGRWQRANLVIHGGTIMSILEAFARPREGYYHWQVGNGDGFRVSLEETQWKEQRCFTQVCRL